MIKCPYCKKEIRDNSKYCTYCGGEINRCPKCNRVLPKGALYCPTDGTKILKAEEDSLKKPADTQKSKKHGKWPKKIIALLLIVLAALLIIAGIRYIKNKKNKTTDSDDVIETEDVIEAEEVIEYEDGDYVYNPSDENLSYDIDSNTVYYNNTVMVYLTEGISKNDAAKMAETIDGELVSYISGSINVIQIKIDETDLNGIQEKAADLMNNEIVMYATFDYPSDIDINTSETNETEATNTENNQNNGWWGDAIGLDGAWSLLDSYDNIDYIKVGVIDGGIDTRHEDFKGADEKSKISLLHEDDDNVLDHGTHVAGIIAAENNTIGIRGISDQSDILYDTYGSNAEITKSIQMMIDSGIKVINMSLGNSGCDLLSKKDFISETSDIDKKNLKWYEISDKCKWWKAYWASSIAGDYESYKECILSQERCDAYNYLLMLTLLFNSGNNQFLCVESAGNGNSKEEAVNCLYNGLFSTINEDTYNRFANAVNMDFEEKGWDFDFYKNHICIVGAASEKKNSDGNYHLTTFSNYGDNVDIVAPGENIYSLLTTRDDPDGKKDSKDGQSYGYKNGTSMAAPMVSATAALLWSIDDSLSAEQVKNILINTANVCLKRSDEDTREEYPMLNVEAAVTSVLMGSVTCKVTDENGNLLSGVKCERTCAVSDSDIFTIDITTQDDGEMDATAIGAMTFTFSKEGYETVTKRVTVNPGEDVDLGNIILKEVVVEGVTTVHVQEVRSDNYMYLIIEGYDDAGESVWTYQTDSAPMAELTGAHELGIKGEVYYIEFGCNLYAFKVSTGELLWKTDGVGAVYTYVFGENGMIYCSGYYGPHFTAIDSNGNIVNQVVRFDENIYWPSSMDYNGDSITIHFEEPYEEQPAININLTDYTYTRLY